MDVRLKPEEESNEKENIIKPNESKKTCDICSKPNAQYTCPKCNATYCNVSCYQSPSHTSCSETFYKDQVLTELKNCHISDENRAKVVDILKRDLKRAEQDGNQLEGVESSDESSTDGEDNNKPVPEIDQDEMLRAYESAIKTWQPWWVSLKTKSSLVHEDEPQKNELLNERLINNSSSINVTNASSLLYNEVLKSSYLYTLLTHVYQLDEDDFGKSTEIDASAINEICSCYLEMEKLCAKKDNSNSNSALDLASKFDYLIACLLQEENYFLKSYINKDFSINLLDDLIVFCKHPEAHRKSLSHLYSLFEMSLTKKAASTAKQEPKQVENKPINVFHINRNPNETAALVNLNKEKKSRVEILSKRIVKPAEKKPDECSSKDTSNKTQLSTKKDNRILMKKLEFYFKWLSVNLASVQSRDFVETVCTVITSLRDSIQSDSKRFDSDKNVIETNLDFIRKKVREEQKDSDSNKKLIEEL